MTLKLLEKKVLRWAGALVLVSCACACSDSDVEHWRAPSPAAPGPSLTFVSPADDQSGVPSTSRIHARLSQPLPVGRTGEALRLLAGNDEEVPVNREVTPDGLTHVLTPQRPLLPGAEYRVVFDAESAPSALEASRFRVAVAGSSSTDGLRVASVQPLDARAAVVWPFTTFYVLFSEPVRPETVVASSSEQSASAVRLVDLDTGAPVPGTLIARGNRVAFDPDTDLVAGKRYRLDVSEGVRDFSGESVSPASREFRVTGAPLTRAVTLAIGDAARPAGTPSLLDGQAVNTLDLRSRLVGPSTLSASGSLRAELPDLAQFDPRVPLVVRKGQVLTLSTPDPRGLLIRLHGRVSTSLFSGPLRLTVLTDSVGEMAENPFARSSPDAPPQVRMTLDASLSAENPAVHALLNQDVLFLQMNGLSRVEDGRLHVEFVGGVELDLLGMETAASFVRLAAASVDIAPPPVSNPFRVLSLPSEGPNERLLTEKALRVILSGPADERTVGSGFWLERGAGDAIRGTEDDVEGESRQDGSTLFFVPDDLLQPGGTYTVHVGDPLRGVSGERLEAGQSSTFTTLQAPPARRGGPLIASLHPGEPCVRVEVGGGLACTLGSPPVPEPTLPAQLPFEVAFLTPVAPETMTHGGSVRIENAEGGRVPGRLEVGALGARFLPDGGWTPGARYRVTLNPLPDAPCGPERICDAAGRALNTDVLLPSDQTYDTQVPLGVNGHIPEVAGGPPLDVFFTASAPNDEHTLALHLAPVTDVNGNGVLDEGLETAREANSVRMRWEDGSVDTSYLSGSLLASLGDYDIEGQGVRVKVSPGSWMFGTRIPLGPPSPVPPPTTERLIIRPAREAVGLLKNAPAGDEDRRPVVEMRIEATMHAANDTISGLLPQSPLVLDLEGRATFEADGTLRMELTNTNDAELVLIKGLTARLKAGDVRVLGVTPALKSAPSPSLAPIFSTPPT